MPGVLEANRHEILIAKLNELGELGLLGCTLPENMAARKSTGGLRPTAREVERVDRAIAVP